MELILLDLRLCSCMCAYIHTHAYIHTYKHTTTTSITTTTTTTITNNNSNNNKLVVIAVFCSNILYLLKLLNYLSCLLRVYMYILKTCQLPIANWDFTILFLDLITILKLF